MLLPALTRAPRTRVPRPATTFGEGKRVLAEARGRVEKRVVR